MKIKGRRSSRRFVFGLIYEALFVEIDAHQLMKDRLSDVVVSDEDLAFIRESLAAVEGHRKVVNELIADAAPQWPLDQMSKIDLAIMQLAVSEIVSGRVPVAIAIDEAVDIAKLYGSESSQSFVNGVLGTVIKNINSTVGSVSDG
tara:strand:- start:3020 stop:3454 length:435 start_codon:yes stop_codon:yes gene_type:complete